jgi:hypothetical protein
VHGGKIAQKMRARVGEANRKNDPKNDHADLAG